jgi:predicted acylesterase/phospholipase RssA
MSDITFDQLYKLTSKNLIITTTNLSSNNCIYLNHVNYPNMSVHLAIKMSCCIPFIFEPIEYNNEYYVDGGLLNMFPIKYIKKKDLSKTIGINIENINQSINNIFQYYIHITKVAVNNSVINKKYYKDNKNIYNIILTKNITIENFINSNNCDLNIDELIKQGIQFDIKNINA